MRHDAHLLPTFLGTMIAAVTFNCQLMSCTVEIKNLRADWVLTPKLSRHNIVVHEGETTISISIRKLVASTVWQTHRFRRGVAPSSESTHAHFEIPHPRALYLFNNLFGYRRVITKERGEIPYQIGCCSFSILSGSRLTLKSSNNSGAFFTFVYVTTHPL